MSCLSLLGLPEEVFYGHLFPKVSTNDVFRLRRTCKTVKSFADAYLRLRHNTQEREINEEVHSFAEYTRRDLPSCKIFLDNNGTSIFEQPEVDLFLEKYADQITHLRVTTFSTCLSTAEDKFYLALKNLQHLEIADVDASERKTTYFPATFQNLKSLKLTEVWTTGPYDQKYYHDFLKFCPNLQHLRHPRFPEGAEDRYSQETTFDIVTSEIEKRVKDNPEYKTPLKVFDMEPYEEKEPFLFDGNFLRLMQLADKQGFRLWNVDSNGLFGVGMREETNLRSLSNTLVSVRHLSCPFFLREMENLEVVNITSLRKVEYYEDGDNYEAIQWPRLRDLFLHIDSDHTGDDEAGGFEDNARHFLKFLFESVARPNLTTLRLAFDFHKTCRTAVVLPCPRAAKIVENCGNLKILHLHNWQGKNKALSKLWAGLEKLEEVALMRCKKLRKSAFVGEKPEDPIFLKLTNLKKFRLSGLDEMPKITDAIFNLVFKHLKIKEFRITSDKPISSVTIGGIRALTEGQFQNSVEKFPFTGWSLKDLGEQEWEQLKNEFRATHML